MPPLWQLDQDLFKAIHVGWHSVWLDPAIQAVSLSGLGHFQVVALLWPAIKSKVAQPIWGGVFYSIGVIAAILAEHSSLAGIGFSLLFALFFRMNTRTALSSIAAIILSGIVRLAYVQFLPRDRPSNLPFSEPLEDVYGSTSFPSGHTTTAFAIATVMVVLCGKEKPVWTAAIVGWAVSVGLARIYVGVHYPLDTLGGALIGTGVGCIVAWYVQNRFHDKTSPIERNLS